MGAPANPIRLSSRFPRNSERFEKLAHFCSRLLGEQKAIRWFSYSIHYAFWYGAYGIISTLAHFLLAKGSPWYMSAAFWICGWGIVGKVTPKEDRFRDAGNGDPGPVFLGKALLGVLTSFLVTVVFITFGESLRDSKGLLAFTVLWPCLISSIILGTLSRAVRCAREDLVEKILIE